MKLFLASSPWDIMWLQLFCYETRQEHACHDFGIQICSTTHCCMHILAKILYIMKISKKRVEITLFRKYFCIIGIFCLVRKPWIENLIGRCIENLIRTLFRNVLTVFSLSLPLTRVDLTILLLESAWRECAASVKPM